MLQEVPGSAAKLQTRKAGAGGAAIEIAFTAGNTTALLMQSFEK